MGGLLGMITAASPDSPITKLVMVDIGPFVPMNSLVRLGNYVGKDPKYDTLEEFTKYLKQIYAQFPTDLPEEEV